MNRETQRKKRTMLCAGTLLYIALTMITAAGAHAEVFTDNFQTCDFSHNEASVGWLQQAPNIDPTLIGNSAACTPQPPCTTQNCAKFEFVGNPDLDSDVRREIKYVLNLSSNWNEIWVEWSQFFPNDWSHRDGSGSDKNQLFTVRTTEGGLFVELAFDLKDDRTDQETIVGSARIEQPSGPPVTINLNQSDTISDVINPLAGKKERWIAMKAHVKLATDGMTDGVVQFWMDDLPIIDANNLALSAIINTNRIASGRFMGLAESGFDMTSTTYITNVRISDTQIPNIDVPSQPDGLRIVP